MAGYVDEHEVKISVRETEHGYIACANTPAGVFPLRGLAYRHHPAAAQRDLDELARQKRWERA